MPPPLECLKELARRLYNMEIKIGPVVYKVEESAEALDDAEAGSTRHHSGVIKIAPYLSKGQYQTTLFHESLHACAFYVGMTDGETFTEEQFINRISQVLLQVLQDNKGLRKELGI